MLNQFTLGLATPNRLRALGFLGPDEPDRWGYFIRVTSVRPHPKGVPRATLKWTWLENGEKREASASVDCPPISRGAFKPALLVYAPAGVPKLTQIKSLTLEDVCADD